MDKDIGINRALRILVRDAEAAARAGAGEASTMEKENQQLRTRVKELKLVRENLGADPPPATCARPWSPTR